MSVTNITTATTTEIKEGETKLKNLVVNKAVASAVITLHDNIAEGVTALDADGIAQSQTPAGGGVQSLTLNGAAVVTGVAYLGYRRTVTVASVADDSGRTFTVSGTDANGTTITEAITGANAGTATGSKEFLTVTGVTTDDNTAGAVTVGFTAANADTVIATITMPGTLLQNHFALPYDVDCRFGLTVVTSGTTDVTVVNE